MAAPGSIRVFFLLASMVKLLDGAAPTLWTTPSIASLNGTATLAETLAENFAVGTVLGSVTINNAATAYEILSQTYSGMFNVTLNSTNGDIYLIDNTNLDFETDKSLTVVIKGSNADGAGVATLTITVTDVNDNAPMFAETSYSVNILSSHANDTAIYVARASDSDSTTNNDISYTISSGDDATAKFSIGVSSGVVKRTGETFSKSLYELVIRATDGGSSALTGSTTLSVCIDCSGGATVMMSLLTTVSGLFISRMLGTRIL